MTGRSRSRTLTYLDTMRHERATDEGAPAALIPVVVSGAIEFDDKDPALPEKC
jgi:hypothetical protein